MKTINKNLYVEFKGELDHHSTEEARKKIDKYYYENNLTNIMFDLRNLTFMDSSGIGLIMGRYKNAIENKGKLVIVSSNAYIDRIIKMSGLPRIIDIYSDFNEALEKI